jgi:hypothetical protein
MVPTIAVAVTVAMAITVSMGINYGRSMITPASAHPDAAVTINRPIARYPGIIRSRTRRSRHHCRRYDGRRANRSGHHDRRRTGGMDYNHGQRKRQAERNTDMNTGLGG